MSYPARAEVLVNSITKSIQVRRTWHAGHCWRSKDELISDVLLWTPTYDRTKEGRLARIYIQQLCEDTRCSPEDQLEAMNDREKWRERVRDIHAGWWWWYIYLLLYQSTNLSISLWAHTCQYVFIISYIHKYIYGDMCGVFVNLFFNTPVSTSSNCWRCFHFNLLMFFERA